MLLTLLRNIVGGGGGGGVAEVSSFTFLSDPADWLAAAPNGKYFTIGVPTGQAYVWFNRDGSGDDPAPSGFVRGILIDPGDISYGTPAQNRTIYGLNMVSVFSTDPDLSATRDGDVITITARATGARADITLGTLLVTDAIVAVITQGSSATSDESDVIFGPTRRRRIQKIDEEDLETLEILTTTLLIYRRNSQL
jgi:hypothetical protein